MKQIKKILSVTMAVILCFSASSVFILSTELTAYAAQTVSTNVGTVTVMPGNLVNGSPKPFNVSMTTDGLKIEYTGGQYTSGGSNGGVVFDELMMPNGFSVEFTVLSTAPYYNPKQPAQSVDSWISLDLLKDKEKYHVSVGDPKVNQGLATLIRPTSSKTTLFEVFTILPTIKEWSDGYCVPQSDTGMDIAPKGRFKVELKKKSSGRYGYFVNGKEVNYDIEPDADFTTLMDSGKFYFYMGASCKREGEQISWVINKINNKSVALSTAAVSSQAASANASSAAASSQAASQTTSAESTAASEETQSGEVSETESVVSETDTESSVESDVSTVTSNAAKEDKKGPSALPFIIIGTIVLLAGGGAAAFFIIKNKKA